MPLTLTARHKIEIAASCAALLLAALIFHAWLAAHDDQLRLASTLATQKQALDAADARERDRNATLKDALAQIDTLKRSAQNETPAQLARALQDALQLPQPITISPAPLSSDAHAPDSRTAGLRPAPLPASTTQQQDPKNSQPETQHHKSLLDLLLHRASPQRLQPIAPASSQDKRRRPRQTHKTKTTHHSKLSRELPPDFPPPTQAPRIQRPRPAQQAPPPPHNPPPKSPPPISLPSTTTSKTAAPANSNSPPPNKTPPTTPPKSAPSPSNATPPSPPQKAVPFGSA